MNGGQRAELSAADINNLPDSAFAYIESGGKHDSDGKTTPRKLRHYPVHDKAHADNALSRANAQLKDGDGDAKRIAKAALPKIKAAVKKFAAAEEKKAAEWNAQKRDEDPSYEDLRELLSGAVSAAYAKKEDEYAYVVDFSDDWVVFSKKGEKYQCSYEMADNNVSLGKAELVKTVTTYVPLESKSAPTPEDYGIASGLKEAKMFLAGVKAKQLADPDLKTDPDDQDVLKAIEKAEGAIDKAIVAQSKDGHEDARSAAHATNWATPKRAFSSLVERPPSHTITAEVRMDESADAANFAGYPSTTGTPYAVRDWLGEYNETIQPGAFAKTLREQGDVPLLFNHDGVPLASTASGTSRLAEDSHGLRNEADFDRRDALTNSICVQLGRGVLNKMSFSFRAIKDAWNDAYDDRGVSEAALYDTSIVTYPANPATSAELVEAMRSAMGREGRSLWLAEHELSVRSTLPVVLERHELSDGAGDLFERALRALAHADEVVARSTGAHGRARTFLVAQSMLDLRAGKTLSAKNEGLLKQALDALGAADKQHQKLANSHTEATEKVASVLAASNAGSGDDGQSSQTPPGNGNPISPQDGAGPRSLPPAVAQARRQVERLKRQ